MGCPWCAAHRVPSERSLAVLCPDLAAELHSSRNGDLGSVGDRRILIAEAVVAL
jgi:hypothetical protein